MDYDVKRICRLCLIKPEYSEDLNENLKEKFKIFFKIDLQFADDLSSLVCSPCFQIVEHFAKFCEKVAENQAILHQTILTTIKIESPTFNDRLNYHDDDVDRLGLSPHNHNIAGVDDVNDDDLVESKFEILNIHVDNIPKSSRKLDLFDKHIHVHDDSGTEQELSKHKRRQVESPKATMIVKIENRTFNDDLSHDDIDRLAFSPNNSQDIDDVNDDTKINDTDDNANDSELDKMIKKTKRRQLESEDDDRIRQFMTLVCDQCETREIYETFTQLRDHFRRVHKTSGYITCCNKKFYRKYILVSHITGHINPDAYKCEMCGKVSKSKSQLQVHMKIHLSVDKREYECLICNQRFATKSLLAKHKISHLPDSEKKFTCDECGKAFGFKNALSQHKLTHSSERNYVCEDCGQSFAVKSYLQNHIKYTHNDGPQPKVQCHICQSWFKNNDTLRNHLRRHKAGQTEHKCEYCDKICSSRDVWWYHVRFVHKKIRPHECNICQKKFRQKCELTGHMAKHTGLPPYKCQYCGRQFTDNSNFSKHRKKCKLLAHTAA